MPSYQGVTVQYLNLLYEFAHDVLCFPVNDGVCQPEFQNLKELEEWKKEKR